MNALREDYLRAIAEQPDVTPCVYCLGQGYVRLDFPVGHEFFGKIWRCPCGLVEAEVARRSAAIMFNPDRGIPEDHRHLTFETFRALTREQRKGKVAALKYAHQLATNHEIDMPDGRKVGIVLSGLPGVGKTSIAGAIALELLSQGNPVVWVDYLDIIDDVQQTYDENYNTSSQPSMKQIIEHYRNVPWLFIDDMGDYRGKGEVSNDQRNIIYRIISRRHANFKFTCFTTNLNKEEFTYKFGGRIARRVTQRYLWIDVKGQDLGVKQLEFNDNAEAPQLQQIPDENTKF